MWLLLRLIIKFARAHPVTFIVLFLALAAIGFIVQIFFQLQLDRLTANAPAEVLKVRESPLFTHRPQTFITYRYVVGENPLVNETTKDNRVSMDYPVGKTVTACYNPDKPEDSEVYEPNHDCHHNVYSW